MLSRRLLSTRSPLLASTRRRALSDTGLQSNLEELETRGWTVLKDLYTEKQLAKMRLDFKAVELKARSLMSAETKRERFWSENEEEVQSAYWKSDDDGCLILQAGLGRFDLYKGFSHDAISCHPRVATMMKSLLSSDFKSYSGYLLSEPGSEEQYFHRDTNNLSNSGSDGRCLMGVDDFYFTTLVPLTRVTVENGPTDFYTGSHRSTAPFDHLTVDSVVLEAGSALCFNGKINHRGTGNRSNASKAALYAVHHKLWYNEFREGIVE